MVSRVGIGSPALCSLGASAVVPSPDPSASLSFTFDSGASRCFFRDSTTLTPLPVPAVVSLADPSSGPVVARSSTTLLCPAVPSGSLTGLHIPSFSRNLVGVGCLEDLGVTTTFPGHERYAVCTEAATGAPLPTFPRDPVSDLFTLDTVTPPAGATP
ncbi:hypothetical protein CLOM_g24008 [Closterium sp. NIES-68]|nr:hypothetical protein CLOM_g24008 [Closterium sp. NIES-68]